ncbi:MAG TPA: hypothetical protein VHQ95_14740 [Pyrinomonadaceae bacterium]|jgi:hypothetical protein|nr:hypothetical protein [Pyrinomonadaceae bacterium]
MKRCPQCNRTYTDDALSFCLDDGSPLVSTAAPSSFDPGATVQYPSSRDTSPQPTIAYPSQMPTPPPPSQPVPPPAAPAWSPMPPSAPQKRSVWPWILGIGAVLVFMGIGVAILIFAIASVTNSNNNNSNSNSNRQANRNSNSNSNSNNTNSATNENSNTRSTLTSFTDDFSDKTWGTGPSQYGNIFYQDEEYHMHATKGGYLVMYSPDKKDYYDENATVRVGLRSIDGNSPTSGYGLTVHGEKKTGNLEDYGFLIYNGDAPKYKIVLHKAGSESKVVDWTPSSTIRTGTNPNQLEVRIRDTKMDFYINGQFVTSIVDEANYKRGRVGFYTSDVGEVAFDDLEISK